jgi:hypothetical protein
MKRSMLKTVLVCALTGAALLSQAATRPRPRPRPPIRQIVRHDAPFDGGVTLLIAAAIAYGIKKAYDSRHEGQLA